MKEMSGLGDMSGLQTQEQKVTIIVREERDIRSFSGDSTDFTLKDFVEEIGLVLRKEQDNEEKLCIVLSYLTGAAKREVKCCGRCVTRVEDVLEILETAFGDRRPLSEVLLAFAERRQSEHENIRTYANDLFLRFQALQAREARMDCRTSDNKLLKIHFVEGLRDKNLAWDLKHQLKNQNLEFHEVREWALEWEEHVGTQMSSQVDVVANVDQIMKSKSQTKELIEQQQMLQMELLELKNKKLRQELEARKGNGMKRRQRVCFKCRSPDHLVKYCKKKKRVRRGVCFGCRGQGHFIKECTDTKVLIGQQCAKEMSREKDNAFQDKEGKIQENVHTEMGIPGSDPHVEFRVSNQPVGENGLGPFLKHCSLDEVCRAQQEDQAVGPILLSWPAKPESAPTNWQGETLVQKHDRLCGRNGLLYRQVTDPKQGASEQLVVPSSLQSEVLASCHKAMGHKKFQYIAEQLRPHVYWPGMYKDLENYLAGCEVCMGV